jgi:hypothetical protein
VENKNGATIWRRDVSQLGSRFIWNTLPDNVWYRAGKMSVTSNFLSTCRWVDNYAWLRNANERMKYRQAISIDKIFNTSVTDGYIFFWVGDGYNLQQRRPSYKNTDTVAAKPIFGARWKLDCIDCLALKLYTPWQAANEPCTEVNAAPNGLIFHRWQIAAL